MIKQPLDKDHLGGSAGPFSHAYRPPLAPGEETMREGSADTAAVEVDDVFALAQREDDAPIESIRALPR